MIGSRISIIGAVMAAMLAGSVAAADSRTAREEVFEFVQKPVVTCVGDKVTVAFESKAFCDATIAVEDPAGRIIRHLVSGVLGPNAPEPLQKNSLKQTVVWDGKNDKGEYVDDKEMCTVRVSLGLSARFERTLLWSPKKRTPSARGTLRLAAVPDGVLVYDPGLGEHLRLFDHDGNYVRTVYPFPADKIGQVDGLTRRTFLGGNGPAPVKWGVVQATLLSWNSTQPLESWPAGGGHGIDGNFRIGAAATALAVTAGKVALVGERVNRFAVDGSSGGMKVHGPNTTFEVVRGGMGWRGGGVKIQVPPVRAALSPDARSLYLAGYMWSENWDTAGWRCDWLHGAARLRFDGEEPTKLFTGSLKQHDWGKADGKFGVAGSVGCDPQGRVYVGDNMNDRIQVFDPDGKPLKSIPVAKPAQICIDPGTGEIWVFSWLLRSYISDADKNLFAKAALTRLGGFDKPDLVSTWDLPLRGYNGRGGGWDGSGGSQFDAVLDFAANTPSAWLVDTDGLRVFSVEKDKLVLRRDFIQDLRKEICQPRPPLHGRQRLFFDPNREQLYVAEQHYPVAIHSKGVWDLIRINPNTGRGEVVRMPASAEDLAFDIDGNIYLRTLTEFARFDPRTWREVPFDYGNEFERFGYQHGSTWVHSAIQTHGEGGSSGQLGGIALSPKGNLAITLINRTGPDDRRLAAALGAVKAYEPRLYPGRLRYWEVHVFNKHGQRLYEDAVTGIGYLAGIAIDKDDFLYLEASARPGDKARQIGVNPTACTLLKLDPRKTRIVTDGGVVPLKQMPATPPDLILNGGTRAWVEGLAWAHPGVGLCGKDRSPYGDCHCEADSRFALDGFARSFASETQNYCVVVLDPNGNVILRIGKYGNVDDGVPLVTDKPPAVASAWPPSAIRNPRSIGGDEVALMHALYLAVHSDRRLFIADLGNYRLLSVKLAYAATESVPLKNVIDGASK